MTTRRLILLLAPALTVLGIDQWTKWVIRTTPGLHNKTIIDGWLSFYYTQNPGMAMGIEFLSTPVISAIAIIATVGILIYILKGIGVAKPMYLFTMGLVIGGALGNITDRLIMGYIEGYGGVLEGHVVDFIHFDLVIGDWPVFPYIFNVADIAISVSIIFLILFNKQFFPSEKKETADTESVLEEPTTPFDGLNTEEERTAES